MSVFFLLGVFGASVANFFQLIEHRIHLFDFQSPEACLDTAGAIAVEVDNHRVSPDLALDSVGDCFTHDLSQPND